MSIPHNSTPTAASALREIMSVKVFCVLVVLLVAASATNNVMDYLYKIDELGNRGTRGGGDFVRKRWEDLGKCG